MRRAALKRHTKASAVIPDNLSVIERDLEELAADYGEGRIDKREWMAARSPLERRRDDARRAIRSTRDDPVLESFRGSHDARKLWVKAGTDQRRAVLGALIDDIVIGPGVPGRRAFDTDRVDIRWKV